MGMEWELERFKPQKPGKGSVWAFPSQKKPDFGRGLRDRFLLGNGKPSEPGLFPNKNQENIPKSVGEDSIWDLERHHPHPLALDHGIVQGGKGHRDHRFQPFPREFCAPGATSRDFGTIPGFLRLFHERIFPKSNPNPSCSTLRLFPLFLPFIPREK